MSNFNHKDAQIFELDFQRGHIIKVFKERYDEWVNNKQIHGNVLDPTKLLKQWEDNFFDNDIKAVSTFINHINNKVGVDIGCGSTPWTRHTWTVSKQYIIDPLANQYKSIQRELFKTSFFEDAIIYSQNAEEKIDALVNGVDGFIFFRNALDHSEDPLRILNNISDYAIPGCYLFFYSDIWHENGGDRGHRCITRSTHVMDKLLKGLGFRKITNQKPIKNSNFIEYGGMFIKGDF
jgi:hypothetical protein